MRRVADTGPGALTSSRHTVEHLAAVAELPRKCPHRLLPSPTIGAEQRAGWHAATQGRGSAKGTGPVFTRSHGRASLPNVQHSDLAGAVPLRPPGGPRSGGVCGRGARPPSLLPVRPESRATRRTYGGRQLLGSVEGTRTRRGRWRSRRPNQWGTRRGHTSKICAPNSPAGSPWKTRQC